MASSCIALAEREKLEGNWPRAAEYLDRACFLGLCGACHELAGLFETGKAAPPHDGRATESRKVECPYLIGPEK